MTQIEVSDGVAQLLQHLAAQDGIDVDTLLKRLLNMPPKDPLVGIFDDDVSDLSDTVRETLRRRLGGNDDPTA